MTSLLTAPAPAPAWWDLATPAGRFTLCPVKPDRDLAHIHRWMNDPAVARRWRLSGPAERTADHLAEQRVLPYTDAYLARLAGRAIGYWELYRAAETQLAAHYPARPEDLGVSLLIGEPDLRGLGLGTLLLTALCDAIQYDGIVQPPAAGYRRIVAVPEDGDVAAVRAFIAAGFTPSGTLALPGKRATLVIRDPDIRSDHGGSRP